MKIIKGEKLLVTDSRKGSYKAIALEDFDTEDEWYTMQVDQKEPVVGLSTVWQNGERITARKGIAKIEVLK